MSDTRPLITIEKIVENWNGINDGNGFERFQKDVWDLYSQGASDVEIKVLIANKSDATNMSNDLWNGLLERCERFSETIQKGRLLSQDWWEKHGRTNLHDKEFNTRLWDINMRNRFKWGDNINIEHGGKIENGESEALLAILTEMKSINDTTTNTTTAGNSEEAD